MKKAVHTLILLVFMVVCLFLLPTTAQAATVASGSCGDNLTWTLDDAGTLTISGTGTMKEFVGTSSPWFRKRGTISSVVIESGVTNIGSNAFNGCSNITSVTIPRGVTSIGDHAFYSCNYLTSVAIPDGVTSIGDHAFEFSGLTAITIPSTINNIGNEVFGYCSNLKSVTIPESVISIGGYAFYDCTALTDVYYTGTAAQWAEITIGSYNEDLWSATVHYIIASGTCGDNLIWTLDEEGVLTISGTGAMIDFKGDPNWEDYWESICYAVIEDGITNIGDHAFNGCKKLTAITIPNSVTSIGEGSFQFCARLSSITIPDSVISIGDHAFNQCGLTSVTIPNSVNSIGDYAFYCCTSLTSATISNSVTIIGDYTFTNCLYMNSVVIPESITSIGHVAFAHCNRLSDVYYGGTEEQWAGISIGLDNTPLTSATIHFSKAASLRFSGAALTLYDNISVGFKVDSSLFTESEFTDPYVVFMFNGVETKVDTYTVNGDRYVFTFSDIAPNQMADIISATLHATYNGEEYAGKTKEYSVSEYCYSMLSEYSTDEYAELRTLLVDLLNYGAASQTYTGYKSDALVNTSLTATQRQWGTIVDPELVTVLDTTYKTVENPTAKWKGAGLQLQESVEMRLKFTAESIDGLSVKIESGTNTWTIASDKFVAGDGVYYVYFTGLDASQMRQNVYLTICDGDIPVSNTVCYSIGSYAYEMQNSTVAGLPELVKAMMKYGDSAYAYVH